MKYTKELRNLSKSELKTRVNEFKKELMKLNVQVVSGSTPANPGKLRQLKKNIARIKTLEKEIEVKGN